MTGLALICAVIGLSSAVVGGVFLGFSDFIMRALLRTEPAAAIAAILLTELKSGEEALGHKVWREVVVTAIRGRGDFNEGLDSLNRRAFDEPVARLLRVLARRGQIAATTDIDAAVALFSDLVMAVFHQQLARNHPWDWVEQRFVQHVGIAMAGLRPV